MQRIHFSVNTFEFCAHKLRAYGLKEECLQKNVNNKLFDRIILLNERIYTSEEVGVSLNLVEQILHQPHQQADGTYANQANQSELHYFLYHDPTFCVLMCFH